MRVVTSRDKEVERAVLEKSCVTGQTTVNLTATPNSILKSTFVTFCCASFLYRKQRVSLPNGAFHLMSWELKP